MSYKDKRAAVMKVLEKYDLDSSAVWNCHGTPVILHKALEEVQVKAKISFDPPMIIVASAREKVAVLSVSGTIEGGRSEWSIGEATPANNKNAYPFAMAEKRAKDRVILKLINLHGLAYSEDEADDFKDSRPPITAGPVEEDRKDFLNLPNVKVMNANQCKKEGLFERLRDDATKSITSAKLAGAWVRESLPEIARMPPDFRHYLREHIEDIQETLKAKEIA